MSIATLILGESGSGKTCSLRNLDPSKCLLIQPVAKPLPFRSGEWAKHIYVQSDSARIVNAMHKTKAEIVILDDFQYILANQFMARRNERGFDKFTDIGGAGFDIALAASQLAPEKRVYILGHTETDEAGNTRIKTLGRILSEKIVLEGMFTIVLRTIVDSGNGKYLFSTQNSGHDTVKSPMGMFESREIENDLASVDETIVSYYGLKPEDEPDGTLLTETETESE